MTDSLPGSAAPASPSLDGLEDTWARRWEELGVYRFDRTRSRDEVYSIDTPPPTVSGSLHVGHVFSFTHTDVIARYQRMRGREVFYPMGWDDNGLPTERRVQNYFGVRCDPSLPYDPDFTAPAPRAVGGAPGGHGTAGGTEVPVSRRTFIELCERLTAEDEQAFEAVWRRLGLSVDWSLTYQTINADARRVSQRAFLRNVARGEAYLSEAPTLWDVTYQTAVAQAELEDRERPGAYHQLAFHRPDGVPVLIVTSRPELLPACVALVAHPDDERYRDLVGTTVRSPLFGVQVPVTAHGLADPAKGTGLAMICTFGDLTDVLWWRELQLATRPVIGRDGRILADPPPGLDDPAGREVYARLSGATMHSARERVVQALRTSGELYGEPEKVTHAVKFYERGDKPLEIVTTRQWYLRNGGRDTDLRGALLQRGRELVWHPEHLHSRYESWVSGLTGDWLVSRQRFFGVPVPVWYPLDAHGDPVYDSPLVPDEAALPVDPSTDVPAGYTAGQRGEPGGFIGDPDVLDTWATSSLTPQIAGRWGTDDDLFGRVFPMDLRPQAHEIIRTWLFSTVVRSHAEHHCLPFAQVAIAGWVLDPDRKKMSKSKGNVVTPMGLLQEYGSDALRYWAASGRPGTDTAFDTGQMKVGRRLAMKILNASRFVLGLGAPSAGATVTEALDKAMLAELSTVVADATAALDGYDHARALERTEGFFWRFCDDYLELAKTRGYGERGTAAAESARAALTTALATLLRLFAPFLPYVTEEVWSWWHDGTAMAGDAGLAARDDSVHRAGWPTPDELRTLAGGVDATPLSVASQVIAAVRKAKSEAKLSMRAEVVSVLVRADADLLDVFGTVAADVCAAGRVARLQTEVSGEPGLVTQVTV